MGLRNYKYFISFLFLHAWLCTYGAVAGVLILYGKTLEPINLWQAQFTSMNGAVLDADFWVVLQYVGQQDGSFMGVVLLCVAVAVMLHCFYIYHFWLISKGLSTNEQDKRVKTRTFLEKYLVTLKKYEQ